VEISHFLDLLDRNTEATLALARKDGAWESSHRLSERWNVPEILEHVQLTDRIVIAIVSRPAANHHPSESIYGDDQLKRFLVDGRSRKITAPPSLNPKGVYATAEEFASVFVAQREGLKQSLKSGKLIVDNRVHKHPSLGEMTVSDWLWFMIRHTERHLEQVKEVLA
jgi:hypothetical protein